MKNLIVGSNYETICNAEMVFRMFPSDWILSATASMAKSLDLIKDGSSEYSDAVIQSVDLVDISGFERIEKKLASINDKQNICS